MNEEIKISGSKLAHQIAQQMHSYIAGLSDEELKALTVYCNRLTTTNCDWMVYEASRGLLGLAKEEKRNRAAIKYCEKRDGKRSSHPMADETGYVPVGLR